MCPAVNRSAQTDATRSQSAVLKATLLQIQVAKLTAGRRTIRRRAGFGGECLRMKTLARESDRTEILGRLKAVRPENTHRWGRMTAHQMVCHLADAFRLALGEKRGPAPRGGLGPRLIKWVALEVPLRWPPGVPTVAEADQERGGTPPGVFEADLAQVEALIATMTAPGALLNQPHPIFGAMSEADWLRWGYLHVDHHLRQFGN